MLGKASEIKTVYVDGFGSTLGFHVGDCGIPADAIVIDIKFSTSYEDGYGIHESALIIYKEAKEDESKNHHDNLVGFRDKTGRLPRFKLENRF